MRFVWKSLLVLILASPSLSLAQAQNTTLTISQEMQVLDTPLDAVAFSPGGTRVATGGRDNVLRVWDVATGMEVFQSEGHTDWLTTLAYSPDGSQIISGSRDDSVRVFDTETGALVRVLGSHDDDVNAVAVRPDGAVYASGGRDDVIQLWNAETGELMQLLDHFGQPVWELAFSPDGTMLASASEDGTIWLWGLWGENAGWLKRLDGHDNAVSAMVFSDDGSLMLSGGSDGTVQLWRLSADSSNIMSPELVMRGHLSAVMGVGFSTDLRVGISASLDGTVRLWDISGAVSEGQELLTIRNEGAPFTNLVFDPVNEFAASVATDGRLDVWDVNSNTISVILNEAQPVVVEAPTAVSVNTAQSSSTTSSSTGNTGTSETVTIETINPTTNIGVPPPASGRVLTIPTLGMSVGVTTFPLDGVSWAIDPWEPIVGHFQGTSWVNSSGNVVIGGHSEMPDGTPGIFYSLYGLGIGDEIFVQDGDLTRRYIVINVRSVDYTDVSVVFPTTFNRLTLITCDIPSYVAEQNIYYERLVIVADEVPLSG
ncbi:MAG: sortase [Chloroflexota bacterium]